MSACLVLVGAVVAVAPAYAVEPLVPLFPLYGGQVSDAHDTEPGNFDLTNAWIEVDPNTGETRVNYWLQNADKPFPVSSDLVAFLVARVGTLEGSSCVPVAEIVVSTGSHETIVRTPGADDWPTDSEGRPGLIDRPDTVADPLLEGVTLDCYVWRVYDQVTKTLRDKSPRASFLEQDPYDVAFTLHDKPRARAHVGQPVDLGVVIEHWNWFDRPRLYDRMVSVEPGPGVTVGAFDGDLGDEPLLEVGYAVVTIPITVTEEGEHTVEVTVTAGNGVSASQTFAFFVPFTPPDWSDSLADHHVFEPVTSDARVTPPVASLWFLDDTWAYFGQPVALPDCTGANPDETTVRQGCVPYWYDAATGQVQVGDWRGTVFDDHLLFDGFDYTHRATQPVPGATYGLEVRNHRGYWCSGSRAASRQLLGNFCNETTTLRLRKDGTYEFRQRTVDTGEHVTRLRAEGRYLVTETEKLRLLENGRPFAYSLLSLGAEPATGQARPAALGLLWGGLYFTPVD